MRISFTTALVLLCCLAAPASQPPGLLPPSDEATRAGWSESLRRERAGDFSGALAALRPLPRSYAVSLRQGWLGYFAGRHRQSAARYHDALRLAPGSLEARLGLLLPLLVLGRNAEAEQVAREILRESPENPLAQARLAAALRQQKKFADAESTLSAAIKSYPTDVGLLSELALVNAARQRPDAARQIASEVMMLDPDNTVARAQLGDPCLSAGFADATGPAGAGWRGIPAGFATNGETRMAATAYFGGITYDHAVYKESGWVGGVDGWFAPNQRHLFEAGVDYLDIVNNGLPDLHQVEATAAYSYFGLPQLKLRLGGHYIATDDGPTDGGWVMFGGVDWFAGSRWSLGLDGCFSRYPDFSSLLDVVQVTPRLSVGLAQGSDWALRGDLKGYWIRLSRELPGVDGEDFFSGEGRLSLFWGRWSLAGFGWAGRQSFAVRNNGYTVYDLAGEYTSGYGAEIKCALGKHVEVGLRFQREQFLELYSNASAAENVFLATIGLAF